MKRRGLLAALAAAIAAPFAARAALPAPKHEPKQYGDSVYLPCRWGEFPTPAQITSSLQLLDLHEEETVAALGRPVVAGSREHLFLPMSDKSDPLRPGYYIARKFLI